YLPALLAAAVVLLFRGLRVVLDNVGKSRRGQDLPPEVIGLHAIRIWWVPGPILVSLVEGQEPRVLAGETGAHADFLVVHGEVHGASARLEEEFLGVSVPLVLLYRVLNGLFCQAVLQFERGERQPVDKDCHVQRELAFVLAIAQLARDAEDVGPEQILAPLVPGRGRAVEEVNRVRRTVLDPAPEHIDDAALRDLSLKAMEELEALRAILPDSEGFHGLWLGGLEEVNKHRWVDGVIAVKVRRLGLAIACLIDERAHDQGLETLLARVADRLRFGWATRLQRRPPRALVIPLLVPPMRHRCQVEHP